MDQRRDQRSLTGQRIGVGNGEAVPSLRTRCAVFPRRALLTCPEFFEPFIPGERLWVDESVRVDIAA
jgi:hypothetical protein